MLYLANGERSYLWTRGNGMRSTNIDGTQEALPGLCAHDVLWGASEHRIKLADFLNLNFSFLGQTYLLCFS